MERTAYLNYSFSTFRVEEGREHCPGFDYCASGYSTEIMKARQDLLLFGLLIFSFLLIITLLSVSLIRMAIGQILEKSFSKYLKMITLLRACGFNLKNFYRKQLYIFVVINIFLGYIAVVLMGEYMSFAFNIIFLPSEDSIDVFNLFNYVPLVILFFIVSAVYPSYRVAFRMFDFWPGDLM